MRAINMRKLYALGCFSFVFAMVGLLAPAPLSAQTAGDRYLITIRLPGVMGVTSDCNLETYFIATVQQKGLVADGQAADADGSLGPPLFLRPSSDVAWVRKYDAGRGTSGVFDGCFGETYGTNGFHGALLLKFGNTKGQSTVSLTWHFDYYVTPGNATREHFTLSCGALPFPAWKGQNVTARVQGNFDFKYYLKEGNKIVSSYTSMTGGAGRYFDFELAIEKIP